MKKFFQQKKLDIKFKMAGEGHRLDEEKKKPAQPQPGPSRPVKPPSEAASASGSAAIARLDGQSQKRPSNTQPMKKKVKDVGIGDSGQQATPPSHHSPGSQKRDEPVVKVVDIASNSIIVHMVCPVCKRPTPHSTLKEHFATCLQEEYLKEPVTASVHMIHTLSTDQDKRKLCVETICKYLDNILTHPGEDKYSKIRVKNKAFSERVSTVEGAVLYLEAIGFQQKLLPHLDGEEQFLVMSEDKLKCPEALQVHKELLTSANPLKAEVDRNLQVFRSSPRVTHFDLPSEFYKLSTDEIKKEQKLRTEVVEKEQMLRTKAMRERDEMKMSIKHYRFVLLRVRMPDGLILQGVFLPLDKLSTVRKVVSESLNSAAHVFSLSAYGKAVSDETMTLAQLGLVPSAVLNFSWDTSTGPSPNPPYLKTELMARIQDLV